MANHDPVKFATGLSARLATRSRHVCAFVGAGGGRACGLPDVAELQGCVLKTLGDEERKAFTRQLEGRNLEGALSRVRRITALLSDGQVLDDLTHEKAEALDRSVCQAIVKELDIKGADLRPVYDLAAWVARADYRLPVELFTVNYDLLLETALDRLRVPYFDGFIGTLRARFHSELVEGAPDRDGEWVPAFFARLWKLHGSINWAWDEDHQIVRLGGPVPDGRAAAIYPCDAKYEESRRVPFVVLHDRLRRALQQPETLVLITGYSFSDEHLNELLFDAAARRERSEFVAFCHGQVPDVLAKRAITTPNLQVIGGTRAILGGVEADWASPKGAPADLWDVGKLSLCEFRHLAAYLARSTTREPDGNGLLSEVSGGPVPNAADAKTDG